MATKIIVGVMGPGEGSTPEQNELAYELGKAIAREGWITLTGGRAFGVMQFALKGASDAGGLTLGILPESDTKGASPFADIKIITGLGSARNNINVLTSHVIVVCGMTPGTASEVSLALKANKKVILLQPDDLSVQFFRKIGSYKIHVAATVDEVIHHLQDFVALGQIS
jgi:uncharacterized protein (TIGR00725 family)